MCKGDMIKVSMQTPAYTFPCSGNSAAATLHAHESVDILRGFKTDSAFFNKVLKSID